MSGRQATRTQRRRLQEAADWILRNREGGNDAVNEAAFQKWLMSDPENRRVYEAAERLMGDVRIAIRTDPALREFEIKPRSVTKTIVSAFVGLLLAGSLFALLDGPMRLRADVIAGTGDMPVLTLEDGSTVHLNASSAVSHDYSGNRRLVRLLRGQAYFEVASDPTRPFQVEAGDLKVTALGTAFDIRLGETETGVTVTQHAVQIDIADANDASIRVSEGEKATYDPETHVSAVNPADSMLAIAWRRGQLVVDNAPLSYVVEELSRHFSGRIIITSNKLARRRVSGTLSMTDMSAALAFLEQALGVQSSRVGPLILIRN